jgi:hypothetical protein
LYHWGVQSHDVINATRASLRVKNRRRQTIGNLGKLEKIEEAFQGASKAVKRTFLMRRRTGDKVKMMQQQAELAAREGALKLSGNTECRSAPSIVCNEPDDDTLERMHVSVSDFCRSSPAEAMIRGTSSINSGDNDAASCVSGFTLLSNSTTASQLEMESFYRELELEMFGEEELPSFVGQTLEVPEFDIPEEKRVYYYRTTEGAPQAPPSITSTIPTYQDGMDDARASSYFNNLRRDKGSPQVPPSIASTIPTYQDDMDDARAASYFNNLRLDEGSPQGTPSITSTIPTYQDGMHDARAASYVNLSREGIPAPLGLEVKLPTPGLVAPGHHPGQIHEFSPQEQDFNRYPVQGTNSVQEHPAMEYQCEGVTEQQYIRHALVLPSTAFQMQQINTKAYANAYSQRHRHESDGPQVRYVPPPAHLSPTNWMDDHESPRIRRTSVPVTISEDVHDEPGNPHFVEVTEQPDMDLSAFDYLLQMQQPVGAASFY